MGQRSVITIGNFDGVHLGHQALLRHARTLAHAQNARVIALAFDPHPTSLLRPGQEPPRLTTFTQRQAYLLEAGADEVHRLMPTPDLLDLSPADFVQQVVMPLEPVALVEGPDFHFGKGRTGTPQVLAKLGEQRGFAVHIFPPVEIDLADQLIVTCASTRVRWLLSRGRITDVTRVLGRSYILDGVVIQGDQRGRTIGIPTANIATEQMLPALGVYAGLATLPDGRRFPAAISVSTRPTFDGSGSRCEVHVLDIASAQGAANLPGLPEYGWPIQISLISWLRDDLKLPGLEAIKGQIARDIARVRQLVAV